MFNSTWTLNYEDDAALGLAGEFVGNLRHIELVAEREIDRRERIGERPKVRAVRSHTTKQYKL